MYSIKCLALGANIPGNTREKKKSRWTFMKGWGYVYIFVTWAKKSRKMGETES